MQNTEIVIQGTKFVAPVPYSEGHTCNAAEAHTLNQTLHENLRNNFATRMKTAKEKNEPVPGQAEFDAYAAEYKFGIKVAGAPRESDPVKAEAKRIIRGKLTEGLKKQGHKVKDLAEGQLETMVEDALTKYPAFLEEAAKIVAARAVAAAAADRILSGAN